MSVPSVRLDDPTTNTLPLPAIAFKQDNETDGLLVYLARIELRSAICQIRQDVKDSKSKDEPIKVEKSNWTKIRTTLQQIAKDGSPDDLFEATMDFLYLASEWLRAYWKQIEEKKDLRLLKEEQSRLEGYLHQIERSQKRSKAVILAIAAFVADEYHFGYQLSQTSISWPYEGSRQQLLQAFIARIKRWKTESERLLKGLSENGEGLLGCRKDDIWKRKHKKSGFVSGANSKVGSENEDGYDTDDILGITSDSDSDADSDGDKQSLMIFKPPPGSSDSGVWKELNNLIGIEPVKRHLQEIIATVSVSKGKDMPTMHLMLTGNPGVGKTTIARLYGRILKDLKVLPGGHLVEEKMSTLTGQYLGHTETNTAEAIKKAQGGVLFIDEVHQLCSKSRNNNDYGKKIIDAIMPELENLRSSFVVIFATYSSEVEAFFEVDPGLRRRVSEIINFPDYSDSELAKILEQMVADNGNYQLEPGLSEKVGRMIGRMRGTPDYANAGSVRNAFEKAQRKLNSRVFKKGTHDNMLKAKDFAFLKDWLDKARTSRDAAG
jgi:Holliday junction resolvasome RuvABC ATP-dependent DNA helicase subunit